MRRLAVKRIVEECGTQSVVARDLGVHRCTVAKWVAKYRVSGDDGLAARKSPGPAPKLTARQRARLARVIVQKNPLQLQFSFALWTLPLVGMLIERLFRVVLHKSTIARMLRNLNITPQVPTRRAFKRDDEECLHWAKTEFPSIVRASRARQSTILFSDECGVHEDGPIGRTWGLRGQRPVVSHSGGRRRVNVISALSPRGRLWFRCYAGYLNTTRYIDFLQALLRDIRGPIDLVVDKHPTHVAAACRRFVQAHPRLRMHYLPGYAPNLNPDEHVWSHLKGIFRKAPVQPGEDLAALVEDRMARIQRDPEVVSGFFGHPEVKYVREALSW
jgi:transposase